MGTPAKKKSIPRTIVIVPRPQLRKPILTFEPFKDAAGEWRWRMRHRNGNIQAMSSESYKRRATLVRVLQRLIRNLGDGLYHITPAGTPAKI